MSTEPASTSPGKDDPASTGNTPEVVSQGDGDGVVKEEDIRLLAHQMWEQAGRPTGLDKQLLSEARRELLRRRSAEK